MFSCNLIQRGQYSLIKPPPARRCGAIGRGLVHAAARSTTAAQISSTIHRSPPGGGSSAAAPGRPGIALGAAAAGRSQGGAWATSLTNLNLGLGLKKDLVGRWDTVGSVAAVHHRAITAVSAAAVHVPSRTVGERQQQQQRCQLRPGLDGYGGATARRRASCAEVRRLDRRWFSAGKKGPYGSSSGGDSSSSRDTDRAEGSISTKVEPAAATAEGATVKKTPKPRKPRKRRVSKGESASPTSAAVAAAAAADGEAAAEAAAAATTATAEATTADGGGKPEAPAKANPKPRKPRKRRSSSSSSSPAPSAETDSPVKGGAPVDSEASAAKAEEEEKEEPPAVKIPAERKDSFLRARREGVAQRAGKGGGGVIPRGSAESNSTSQSLGEEESESSDDAPFPWKEASSPPHTWQDPKTPERPKEFVAGGGGISEEGESGAAAAAAAGATGEQGSGKAPRRRSQHKKPAPPPQEPHPVLGHFVADLGYKRVYVTSLEGLVKAPIWGESRILRPVHTAEIFRAKKLEAQRLEVRRIRDGKQPSEHVKAKGMPGIFTLYKRPLLPLRKRNQQYVLGIVDGQHRLGALLMLAEEGMWDPAERNVIVEVLDVADDEGIEEIFAEINSAEPVKIDLSIPGPAEIQKLADEVVFHLYKEYRAMFGGERIRPPSLHASTFKQNLLRSGVIERHELYTPNLLLDYLLRVNDLLSKREETAWEQLVGKTEGLYSSKRSLMAALKRARRHKFFLGMEASWMLV